MSRELYKVEGSYIKCSILLTFNIELNVMKEYLEKDSSNQAFVLNALKNDDDAFLNNKEDLRNLNDIEEIPYLQLEGVKKINNDNSN